MLPRTAGGLAEDSERGRGPGVSTRMHRRAGAHPRIVGNRRWAQSDLICDFACPGHEDRDHFHAGSGRKRQITLVRAGTR